jgi:hypothetical protein
MTKRFTECVNSEDASTYTKARARLPVGLINHLRTQVRMMADNMMMVCVINGSRNSPFEGSCETIWHATPGWRFMMNGKRPMKYRVDDPRDRIALCAKSPRPQRTPRHQATTSQVPKIERARTQPPMSKETQEQPANDTTKCLSPRHWTERRVYRRPVAPPTGMHALDGSPSHARTWTTRDRKDKN